MKVLLFLLCALAAGLDCSAQDRIAFVPCFGQTGNDHRLLNPKILNVGHEWTRRRLEGEHRRGNTRFLVHLPFGRNAVEPMDFDGHIEASNHPNAAVRQAAESYVPQMTLFLEKHPDAHLYTYLGSPLLDPDLVYPDPPASRDESNRIRDRYWQSIAAILDLAKRFPGRVGLAYDHAHDVPRTHPMADLLLETHRMLELPLIVEGGRHVEPYQAEAGFARLMIAPRFTSSGPVKHWPGEQIALAGTSGRYAAMPRGWMQETAQNRMTACGY